MQLEEFYNYKNRLVEDMLTSEEIVSLIDETVPVEEAATLMYKNIFPYEYLPETTDHGKTYVCCDVDVIGDEKAGKTFLYPVIYVWVFTHKSLMRAPNGGVRVDKLCSEICKKINGSRFYGMGELNFYSSKRFAPMTDFQGKYLAFHAKDFSKQYDPKKLTPINRRIGNVNS